MQLILRTGEDCAAYCTPQRYRAVTAWFPRARASVSWPLDHAVSRARQHPRLRCEESSLAKFGAEQLVAQWQFGEKFGSVEGDTGR